MNALVIGLAVSGRAAAELLRAEGYSVSGYDARNDAGVGVELDSLHTGEWSSALLEGVDLVVPSPGVPEGSAPIVDALNMGLPVWSELELGTRRLAETSMAAVTGTNGKTTITELISAMLMFSGMDAPAVGNIGDPVSGPGVEGRDAVVVEASSFQLRFIDRFAPDAAVLINFAPDHLDWHSDLASYAAAKARVFENMKPDAPVVFDLDDPGASGIVSSSRSRLIGVSGHRRVGDSGPESGQMWLGGATVSLSDLPRRDPVMLVDLAAAAETAVAIGATAAGIEEAAIAFVPGRHRREVVLESEAVTWVNDSKATNPHAALASIGSYRSVVLIAGGRAKGLDIRPLATADSVRAVIALGESAQVIVDERSDALTADSMEEAVELARTIVQPGDVVLLAPGCASFDMFDSYGHRGDVFAAAVLGRSGK